MKKFLAVLLSTSVLLGSSGAAEARDHGRNNHNRWDNHNSRNYDRHDRHDRHGLYHNGAGLALGIFAGATALAIASNAYSHPVYVQPQPVYVAPRPVYVQRTVYRTEYRPVRYAEVW